MHRYVAIVLSAAALLPHAAATARAETPSVVWETSIPGYNLPHARDVVVDEAGNACLIGSAYENGSLLDVLVVKLGPAGDVLWTRYISGNGHSYATGLALDAAGDVWVTGWTDADDFPVVNAMDATLTGFRDAFLLKLDGDDGTLVTSTFLGGDYTERAEGIALTPSGEIWLTGTTGSTDFPVTEDAWQGEPSFPLYFFTDAFVTRLSATGDEILYSTYLGGLEDDVAEAIALGPGGNVVIAGRSNAADFPLVNPLQAAHDDLFVAELSADGGTLLFSTFLGGEDLDRLGDLAVDAAGRVHLVGSTRSVAFPTTPGAFQETFVGAINGCEVPFGADENCEDFFVTKLATDGAGLLWSTYLGGTEVDEARALAVDGQGRVYVAGYTTSPDFPPAGTDFGAEIVVCRLDPTGSVLDYTHSVDSGSANRGNGIAVDGAGGVWFTGTLGVPASVYVAKLDDAAPATGAPALDGAAVALALAPNPFGTGTRIEYTLPAGAAAVRLCVHDVAGRIVRRLVDAVQAGGPHAVEWSGTDDRGIAVSSGVYFVRLEAPGIARTRKVVRLAP